MFYFARISSRNTPANKLQKYLMELVSKYDNVLLDDPEALAKAIEQHASRALTTFNRCSPVKAYANRDFTTKAITGISAGGLFHLSIHPIAGMYDPQTQKIKDVVRPSAPVQELPKPTKPAPEPTTEPTSQPRQAIHRSRTEQAVERLEFHGKFSPDVQRLLAEGRIWSVYVNPLGDVVAEEFGGKTHKAYP